jgi:ABC-type transport system involved in cytochrome c biogenesis permease component
MLSWPVIQRELLVEARRPGNHRMRSIIGAVVCGLLGFAAIVESIRGSQSGYEVFITLHRAVLITILALGPVLTSDTLSKEAREGTLGLLFLTPLSARQIVGGKFLVHFLRLLTIWTLCVPFLIVPMLMGGVSWTEASASLLIQLCAGVVSVAAGILASSKSKKWLASLALAQVISWSMTYLVFVMGGAVLVVWMLAVEPVNAFPWFDIFPLPLPFALGSKYLHIWAMMLMPGPVFHAGLAFFATVVLATLFVFRAFLRRASKSIARFPEAEIETVRQIWFRRIFLAPRFWKSRFWRGMRRKLDKNPLIWLEYRSAWSRSFRWTLLLIVIAIDSMAATQGSFPSDYLSLQLWLGCGLLVVMAFSAASSFQKERESGAFELLLVTPMRVAELIWGRLSAVWGYYWPTLACIALFALFPLLLGVSYGFGSYDEPRSGLILFSEALSFFTVPIVGLALALKTRNFFTVFIPTVLVAVLVSAAIFDLSDFLFYNSTGGGDQQVQVFKMILILHVGLGVVGLSVLHSSLTQRRIVTSR